MPLSRRLVLAAVGAAPLIGAAAHSQESTMSPNHALSERHALITQRIAALGIDLGRSQPGGAYAAAVEDRGVVEVSGMVPSLDGRVIAVGRVGAEVTLEQAQHAAMVSALRCLKALEDHLGDLGRIRKVTKMSVYMQAAPGFYQLSEVSNGASELLAKVLAPAGAHARTSIGGAALPRNAVLELDMTVAVDPA
ncbi:RidA family protein [Caulobacter sp. FWC2]|uniref:RidA family protein n=1 Tax=Caulobacter sp. FWC2 TaxID=69664 RepID=UPI001304315D|nr:RidA family protein [Caulobacter sp. FWC2]